MLDEGDTRVSLVTYTGSRRRKLAAVQSLVSAHFQTGRLRISPPNPNPNSRNCVNQNRKRRLHCYIYLGSRLQISKPLLSTPEIKATRGCPGGTTPDSDAKLRCVREARRDAECVKHGPRN